MIHGRKVLALIPARGGSKGIKNKNIIDLCGRPLISYSVNAAVECEYVDDVVVSTDSEVIAEAAKLYGADVPFLRPDELASDRAKTIDAVINAVEQLERLGREYDLLVLLQPTSPLRTAEDIKGAIEKFEDCEEQPLVAISKVSDAPYLIRKLVDENHMEKLLPCTSTIRRQDMEAFYRVNGSIYINRVDTLSHETSLNDNSIPYVIDEAHAVDIDSLADLKVAEYYLRQRELS